MAKIKDIRTVLSLSLLIVIVVVIYSNRENPNNEAGEERLMNAQHDTVVSMKENNHIKQPIEQYIRNEPKLNGALIGISIRSADTGEILYDYMGDIRLRPASNMKLFTGAVALSILGEDYTFPTEILTDGEISNGQLMGNLYLKGKGDPTLMQKDFNVFAKKLVDLGVSDIDGNIIADDSWFDDVRLSNDLIWSDEHYYYGAQVSALTASPNKDYDSGTVIVKVIPNQRVGQLPEVQITPETNYVKIINKAKIVNSDKQVEEELTIEREHGNNTIIIKGEIPSNSETVSEFIAVWEPTGYALDLFHHALEEENITISGTPQIGKIPAMTNLLFSHQSLPLSELVVPFMKLSNNGHAETLVKEMGKTVHGEGSWEKGLEVMEQELPKFGVNIDTLMIRDGSGISHVNLIPANEITKLLYTIQHESWFSTFMNSLPEAGVEDRMVGGTLRNRMSGMSVHAKTGTINGVSTLSGYVEANRGEKLIFSIMINNLLDEDDGPALQDKLVEIIATGK